MVERSAHNGLVVGSNPTKLNYMLFYELNKKVYKMNNIRKNIKKPSFIIFISGLNKNSNSLNLLNQKTKSFKLYKISNKAIIKNLKNNFLIKIINSSIFLGILNKNILLTKTMLINSFYFLFLHILALKINNKIYSTNTLNKLPSLNYFQIKQLILQFCTLKTKIKFNF